VRKAYREAAERYGVEWRGRRYDRFDWNESDAANRALSAANACLNGVCHAALLAAGYAPGLGFIHQGKQLSFVYDVADLYKTVVSIPVAFAAAAEAEDDPTLKLARAVRLRMRQAFRNTKLLRRILSDIEAVLDIEGDPPLPDGFDPDDDPALPTPWWDPPAASGDGFGPLGDGDGDGGGAAQDGSSSSSDGDDAATPGVDR
jgi:CRISPR-associated protein Cas1